MGAVFGVDGVTQQSALRGRIKHLQRLGLPGLNPGKGARLDYSVEQASQWLLVLLLSEAGVEPVLGVKLVRDSWPKYLSWFKRAQDLAKVQTNAGSHVFLTVRPHLLGKEPDIAFAYRRQLGTLSAEGLYTRNLTDALNVFHDNLRWD